MAITCFVLGCGETSPACQWLRVLLYAIARWLKKVLEDAGIDVSILLAHSIRGASSSPAALAEPIISWKQQTGVQSLFSGVSIISYVILPRMVMPRVMQSFQLIIKNKSFLNFHFPHSYNSLLAPADLDMGSLHIIKLQISPLICETKLSEI